MNEFYVLMISESTNPDCWPVGKYLRYDYNPTPRGVGPGPFPGWVYEYLLMNADRFPSKERALKTWDTYSLSNKFQMIKVKIKKVTITVSDC